MGPAGLHPLAGLARAIPPTVALCVVHNVTGQERYLTSFPWPPLLFSQPFVQLLVPVIAMTSTSLAKVIPLVFLFISGARAQITAMAQCSPGFQWVRA